MDKIQLGIYFGKNTLLVVLLVMVNFMCQLEGCFWMRLTFTSLSKQTAFHIMGGPYLISQRPEENKKNSHPQLGGILQQSAFNWRLPHNQSINLIGSVSLKKLDQYSVAINF